MAKIRKRLGEILMAAGKLSPVQLEKALEEKTKSGEKLGKVIVKMGILGEGELLQTLSEQLRVPIVDLGRYPIDESVIAYLPADMARNYQVLPIGQKMNILTLAMVDPLDIQAIDEVIHKTQREVEPVLCTEVDMKYALDRFFGTSTLVDETIRGITQEEYLEYVEETPEEGTDIERLKGIAEGAPVIRLVNNLLTQAILDGASDIHIEPAAKSLRTRFRIDGALHELSPAPKQMQLSVISRIKIMSKMDIAKMRVPQDGRFDVKVEGKDVSVRVSTFPTFYGENVVMRLLDKSAALYDLDKLGFSSADEEKLKETITKPYGFILSTGPTGSGKTTCLYAVLNYINSVEKNIITLEDPIEYTLDLVRQAQVNPKAGMTFAAGLRSILRQDPDVVMVGEIRDSDTATIAIQSALTGHLVLSTLHTNDAASAVTRLVDMGVEPFLVASSVTAVIGQRLLRTICQNCRQPYTPPPSLLKQLGIEIDGDPVFYRGKGCVRCRNTGYKGRTGVFEVLTMNDEIRELTMGKLSSESISKAAQAAGMQTMRKHAVAKALQGITTIQEALTIITTK